MFIKVPNSSDWKSCAAEIEKFCAADSVVKYLNWRKNTPIFTLNIEDLSPGVYNVIISISNEYSKTNKLVVIH